MSHEQRPHRIITDRFFRNKENCGRVLKMFSLFSGETRFKILCVLNEADFCVNDIVNLVDGKHSNISQQLKMLTLAGYLTKERRERSIIYHLKDEKIKATMRFLCELFGDSTP